MLDERSLRQLAEMGIDVYLPRAAARGAEPVQQVAAAAASTDTVPAAPVTVLLVAEGPAANASRLLGDVRRALGFGRIDCRSFEASDDNVLDAARALVVFGQAQVRAVGARMPAQRQQAIDWVVAAEPAALAGNAVAKRALWSELRRMLRGLSSARGAAAGASR